MGAEETSRSLTCMEVWGGNEAADAGVSMPGLDAWVFARPHMGDKEGGDIHYVSSCATGRITRLLLADVSGHGQSAASFAITLRDLMRRFINVADQKKLVRSLNRAFTERVEDGRFATAVVVSYWSPSKRCTVCSAGHPRPLLFRASEGSWTALDPGNASDDVANIPLGITESTYDQIGLDLAPGDRLLLYSDSLIEFRMPDGKMLGERGLLELVERHGDIASSDFIRAILDDLDAEADDDLTVMLIVPNDQKPRPMLEGMIEGARISIRSFFGRRRKADPVS